tara:strand:+ start:1758 stop:2090 length:333 start_codon:yes stop_codon:yes gene_type:complete
MRGIKCKHCGSTQLTGYIYAFKNPAFKGWVKVGKTTNLKNRLRSFNTGSPFKDFECFHSIDIPKTKLKTCEKKILKETSLQAEESKGEWRKISNKKLMDIFNCYKIMEQV